MVKSTFNEVTAYNCGEKFGREAGAAKWRELVVILPDDAEPEVGDLVYMREPLFEVLGMESDKSYEIIKSINGDKFLYLNTGCPNDKKDLIKIIQRNGKPVIYQSQLAAQKE